MVDDSSPAGRVLPPEVPTARGLLADKTVAITAAAGTGIGFATAKRCAQEGAKVLLSDVHAERLERCADALEEEIGRAVPRHACDVGDQASIDAFVAFAERDLGRIDVLINNAGLGMTRSILETTPEDFLHLQNINLSGTFRMMRAVLPEMIARASGAIVNVSSICAWRAEAGQSAYAASKAGVLALTRCAALESAEHGVRINAVVPSLALHPYLEKVSSPEFLAQMVAENEVLGRAAETWEVANTIVFLASDYASYLTGESLSVSCRRA